MTDRKVPRDNQKLSLAPLSFEEALEVLLQTPPPASTKPEAQAHKPRQNKPPSPRPPKERGKPVT